QQLVPPRKVVAAVPPGGGRASATTARGKPRRTGFRRQQCPSTGGRRTSGRGAGTARRASAARIGQTSTAKRTPKERQRRGRSLQYDRSGSAKHEDGRRRIPPGLQRAVRHRRRHADDRVGRGQ